MAGGEGDRPKCEVRLIGEGRRILLNPLNAAHQHHGNKVGLLRGRVVSEVAPDGSTSKNDRVAACSSRGVALMGVVRRVPVLVRLKATDSMVDQEKSKSLLGSRTRSAKTHQP